METLSKILESGIIVRLQLNRGPQILPQLAALCSGGVSAAEFPIENPMTMEALRSGSRLFPDLMLGAGGIMLPIDAQRAIDCGARFLTSVGYSQALATLCKEQEILYLPQCMTPTELLTANMQGLTAVSLYAPHLWGNQALVSSLASAFPKLTVIAAGIPKDATHSIRTLPGIAACSITGLENATPEELAVECQTLMRLLKE